MNDFISTIRTDREREMFQRKNNGIKMADLNAYRYIDEIETTVDGVSMKFGVQATNKDVYFFLLDEGGNRYFTIVEIYELLRKICIVGHEDVVVGTLKKMVETKVERSNEDSGEGAENWINRGFFIYKGVKYYMKECVVPEYRGRLDENAVDGGISYVELFALINLIQEKSNAFFRRGKYENKYLKYENGILRLLISLLSIREDSEVLKHIGWIYDAQNERFIHNPVDKDNKELNIRKYHLTEKELLDIINSES